MRRILAVASATTLTLGLTVGVAPTASAADLGTVTVSYDNVARTYSISPSSLSGTVGDTFTLRTTMRDNAASFVSLVNSTGTVTLGGASCSTDTSCRVLDNTGGGGSTGVFTVTGTGSVTVRRYLNGTPGTYSTLGTLTITASSSGGGGVGNLVNRSYTATVDANGGSCTGTTSWQRIDNDAAFPGVFTLPSANNCTRPNYTLAGWALTANATTVRFAPLSPYVMGNSNVTLYAVWRPLGVEVVYDANVGAEDPCTQGRANVVGDARQSAPVVLQEGRDGGVAATQAPCTPYGFPVPLFQLAGWALTGDGPSVVAPGAALPASFTSGSSYVLYAKWQVVFGLTFSTDSLSMAPGQQATVTITATLNGAPAANAVVGLAVAPAGQFGLGSVLPLVVTDAAGQARVTVISSANLTAASPPTTLTAAYGNTTASVQLTPAEAVKRTIVIAGKRSTLSSVTVIRISGKTSGFAAGDRVIPYIRFLGETDYFEDWTRPEVGADGSFYWRSEAGQDLNVYFASEDGSVRSNALNFLPAR